MNIFFLSWNIKKCVRWYFNSHVIKMIIEYAQLLSTAHWYLDNNNNNKNIEHWFENGLIYKQTHINHPCSIWIREHINNYRFLAKLAKELCKEYYFRYGKDKNKHHKTEIIINHLLINEPINIPNNNLSYNIGGMYNVTKPPQAMPDKYKDKNTIEAYRNYYLGEEKSHLTFWKNRKQPIWFDTDTNIHILESDSD